MNNGPASPIDDLDLARLTPPVRRLLGQPTATVLDWQATPVAYHAFLPGRSVVQVAGHALVNGARVAWRLILKHRAPPAPSAQPDDGWRREALAYQSGLLAALPGRLTAPRLLGSGDDATGAAWLWLEAVSDRSHHRWPLAQFGLVARHLGQFNGAYLAGRPLPTVAWLRQDWATWQSMTPEIDQRWPEVEDWACQVATTVWPQPHNLTGRGPRLLRDQQQFIALVNTLPPTLCHHDAAQANLLIRRAGDGADETVAIDWEEIGPGAVGADLATLVFGTIRRGTVPAEQAEVLDQLAWAGYLAGLRDAGWHGDERTARLGYTAAIALRWSLLWTALRAAVNETARTREAAQYGMAADAFVVDRLRLAAFLLDRADEARRLAGE